ncbi:hypothetical protein BGLA2_1710015 [Burkholderia gladioli]|nr:hypothetical protein BGLA2_1710015 [Burkholderia gladioli]
MSSTTRLETAKTSSAKTPSRAMKTAMPGGDGEACEMRERYAQTGLIGRCLAGNGGKYSNV